MRMRVKPRSAFSRQPGTGDEPVTAVDPPELSPSVLTMGIPCFIPCIGTPSPMAPSCRSFVSPPNARKQASLPRGGVHPLGCARFTFRSIRSVSSQTLVVARKLAIALLETGDVGGAMFLLRQALDCIASSFGREDPMRSVRAG